MDTTSNLPGGFLSLTTAALLAMAPALAANAQQNSPTDLLRSFESALVDVVENVEPSVVAIVRSPGPSPKAVAAAKRRRDRERQFQPGELQALQALDVDLGGIDPFEAIRGAGASSGQERVTGAGVVIDASGLVLTQYLVVKPGDRHTVATITGERLPAEIVGADPRSGLAVLRVRSDKLKPIEFGQAEDLRKGNLVVVVGNPYSLETDGQPTASYGVVSNTSRKAPNGENLNDASRIDLETGQRAFRTTLHHFGTLIQTDARLGWNASGGAMVTLDGKLVGLTTTVATIAGHEQPAGYAIPINSMMRRIIATLKEGREVEYGLLGIRFQPNAATQMSTGAMGVAVWRVYPGSAANRAGLQTGDLIAEVDGQPTPSPEHLQLAVGSLPPGEEKLVVYERSGQRREATVRLDKIFVTGNKVITNRPPAWQGIRVDFATATESSDILDAALQKLLDPQGCVAVVEVEEGSVSWQRGVRPGMFISHVSGQRVATPQQFRDAVRKAGGSVKLRFTPGASPKDAHPVDARPL